MTEPLLHGYNGPFSGEPFLLASPDGLKVLCVMVAVELHPHPLGLSNCSEASGAPTLHPSTSNSALKDFLWATGATLLTAKEAQERLGLCLPARPFAEG